MAERTDLVSEMCFAILADRAFGGPVVCLRGRRYFIEDLAELHEK